MVMDTFRLPPLTYPDSVKQADRPDSATAACAAMTVIRLGAGLLRRSSFLPARSASRLNACLFGIAPGGGYRVSPFATQASQRLVSVALFLALYLAAFGGRPLAVTPPYGVRTFLPPSLARRPATVWLASPGILLLPVLFRVIRQRRPYNLEGMLASIDLFDRRFRRLTEQQFVGLEIVTDALQ